MKKFRPMPALDDLKEYLQIDSSSPSGLKWIKTYTNRVKANSTAGNKGRYWTVSFKGNFYSVHRIIYFMHYGVDPGCLDVEHKDGNKHNNSPENLRLATRQQNNANTRSAANSSSKYKGVHWSKRLSKWIATITKDYKSYYLGLFTCEKEAALAYNKQAKIFYGDYALLNKVKNDD
jgi:hypothetical protein